MRFKIILLNLSFLFLLPSFGQITIIDTIESGGLERNYRLYIPTAYDGSEPVPLVLNLHGYTSDAFGQDLYANFRVIADTANFLIVLPNGTLDGFGQRYWNCFIEPGIGVDDVAFLSDLIDSISANYNVDANRIYSTGMSNGGFMSHALACELSNKIAAIASVAGSIDEDRLPACDPQHVMPVMQIHGTEDETVPFDGSFDFIPVESVIDYWTNFNNCDEAAEFTAIEDVVPSDSCTAEHFVYGGCNKNINVELYKIIDGGHTWPGTALTFLGVTNLDINACKEIWYFFSRYRLDELTSVQPDLTSPKNNIIIQPNPASELININISNNELINSIILYDIKGRKILTLENIQTINYTLPINEYANGTYFIQVIGKEFNSTVSFIKE